MKDYICGHDRKINETKNILPEKKRLQVIINAFEYSNFHLQAEEVDFLWVNPSRQNYDLWMEVIWKNISAQQKKISNQGVLDKCFKVWGEVWVL